jgi:hypothetical protein
MHFDGISVSVNNHRGWGFLGVGRGHHASDIAGMLGVLLVGCKRCSLLGEHSEDSVTILAILVVVVSVRVC